MKKFIGIIALILIIILQSGSKVSYAAQDESPFYPPLNFSLIPEAVPQKDKEITVNNNPISYENIIYMENQHAIDAINPQKQENATNFYPGLRGPNQLIVYTPKYGIRTGTNEYGTEAIVENNMVVSLNGADSIIPYKGFVISGHGKAKTWIMQNIQVGTKVYIDYYNKTLKCFLTPDSLLYAAKEKIREVNSLVEYYRQLDILYNDKKANDYLDTSKDLLRKAENRPEKTQTFINEAMKSLDEAIKNTLPYYKSELKGIWVRPVEDTPEKIEKTVERMYNTGITDIFLETFYHGKTIYHSDYLMKNGVIPQREEFIGFDPLAVWIKEAHKRKMKVHIWFECFYIGNDNPKTIPNHILSVYPEWSNKRLINYTSEEPVFSRSEHNGYFLDPANIQVQAFLYGILKEIIDKYRPDGINLDYIRYPITVEPNYSNYALLNWGYTETARSQFRAIYGVDPVDITYGTFNWELWSLFRQNKISDFVKNVKQMSKPYNINVTAVIFPDIQKCLETKMQNWKLWSIKNYVDGFTPLILTGDKNTAVMLLEDITNNISPSTQIYPGIFVTFMGGSFEDLLIQIHKTREYRSKGAVIFDYAHLSDKYTDALKTRVYNRSYEEKDKSSKETKPAVKTEKKDYKPEIRYKDNKKKAKRKNK